jgi:hypothetical protein
MKKKTFDSDIMIDVLEEAARGRIQTNRLSGRNMAPLS